jgi:hypothetical protein
VAKFDFDFVKGTAADTDSTSDDTDFSFLPKWLDGTLHIPIGIDPTLIDPKTWTNWTSPDSDVWPLTPTGASDSDSNIEVSDGSDISPYETAIRIVFHYLTFALGKAQATKTMNKMSVSPTFAVQSVVQAQNDDSCATAQGEGWSMAQMTTEEFMDSANQAQVAKVVTQAVGPNVPVMTGVRTASGDCLTVEAVGDDTVWTQSDCEEAAPALCVAESPAEDSNLFVATVPAEIGEVPVTVEASISIHPVSFLMAGLCATALFGVMQARRMNQRAAGSAEEKMPLNQAPEAGYATLV